MYSALPKNRFCDFMGLLCTARQSGKLIIFLYPMGSTGARSRKSANFVKTDKFRLFI
jgi:hypothetical protein